MKKIKCRQSLLLQAVAFLIIVFFVTNVRLLLTLHQNEGVSSQFSSNHTISSSSSSSPTRLEHWWNGVLFSPSQNQQQQQQQTHVETPLERRRRWKKLKASDIPLRKESVLPNATFSACLLIRDDNDLLPEWLAYHYHAVGLRDLIVAVDPLSSESPSSIFQTWRQYSNMSITEWTDNDYMPKPFLLNSSSSNKPLHRRVPRKYMQKQKDFKIPMSKEALQEVTVHRYRQRVFLSRCMKAQRDKKKGSGNSSSSTSWLLHIDTDEFVVASKLLRENKPDYIKNHLPDLSKPNSVLHFIQAVAKKTSVPINYPCIPVLRVLFGSVVDETSRQQPDDELNRASVVPSEFNVTTFETLRFHYHAPPDNVTIRGNPKVIMDVAAMPDEYFEDDEDSNNNSSEQQHAQHAPHAQLVFSIHRPFENFCRRNSQLDYKNFRQQPIAVNHYLGSWERYAGRKNDRRRSREIYDAKANLRDGGKDDGVQKWLSGFTKLVGRDNAVKLLGEAHLKSADPTTPRN